MKPAIERIADALEAISEKMGGTEKQKIKWIEENEEWVICPACGDHWNKEDNEVFRFCYCPYCGGEVEVDDDNR